MSNDVKLQEGHPVDENLRPIKVGGKSTAIETAQHGNGARVNGDLEVTGNIKGTAKDMVLEDIIVDSLTTDSIISTDLNIDASGDIILDSGGNFVSKILGTEFSVANSAYAGMILGYTTVGIDATADSHTLVATTMTVTDADHNVSFIAPPSGVVEIFVSVYGDFARRNPVFGLSDNATYAAIDFPNMADPTNEHILRLPPSAGGDTMLINRWVVTGLTAGTTYKWWLGAKTSIGTGVVLRWGGTATNQYPPFIMKATALPTAVEHYAVYG